ncbi:MAG: Dps family protein [Neisseria sp.]|nr:Dps family protein [Neisseria sp.]
MAKSSKTTKTVKTADTQIGLDKKSSAQLAEKLNALLANYQVYYMNVRGYHWNVKGANFFELHLKFEEIYNDLLIKIDEIAERVLTLGHTPAHTYSAYIKLSDIKEAQNVVDGRACVEGVLAGFEALLPKQREILALAGAADDEGTSSQMSDYIKEQEKLMWMFNAYLAK